MNSNNSRLSSFLKLLIIIILAMVVGGILLIGFNYTPNLVTTPQEQDNILPSQSADPIVIVGPTNIADMVEKVSPAVVNIETSVSSSYGNDYFLNDPFFRQFFGDVFTPKTNIQQGIGTGFIISDEGYVVTNQHVIDKADKIIVNINDEEQYSAKVVGQDYELDLAVLKIDANKKFSTLSMGDSDNLRVGEWVIAIGNPYGLDHTVTAGLVSAKGRPMNIEDRVYKNLIQTDAAINPGNSGGPLLSTNGEVIGINTAVNAQAQGIGFAIPINTAKQVLNELIQKGKVIRPYIGVWLQTVDEEIADYLKIPAQGAIVVNVASDSPASKAGIKKYDIILAIDEQKINDAEEVNKIVASKNINDRIVLEILREGSRSFVTVQLAEKP